MERFLLLITILRFACCMDVRECGPYKSCECTAGDSFISMTCNNRKAGIDLEDICSFVQDEGNIMSLKATGFDAHNLSRSNLIGCQTLKDLILSKNAITYIEEGIFESFDMLDQLDLSSNEIDIFISGYKFLLPPNLKTLKLNGNFKQQTVGGFYPDFIGNYFLEALYIDGINGAAFHKGFLNLSRLTFLSTSGLNGYCSLNDLSEETFQYLVHLKYLNISSCGIETIAAETFKQLPSLEILDISYNTEIGFPLLSNISYGLQFTSIASLNYSHVNPTFGLGTEIRLNDVCFLHNTSIVEVVFDSNRVEMIETNVFILMPTSLKRVSLNDNIFSFGLYLLQLGCLQNLNEIYGSFQNKLHRPSIEKQSSHDASGKTYVSDCPYMKPEILSNLSSTIDICTFFNTSEPVPLYPMPTLPRQLHTLLFSDCNMKFEIDVLPILPSNNNLKYLDMSGNTLFSWKGPVGPFLEVKYLDLSRNYCYFISSTFFQSFPSVESLLIDRNFIGYSLINSNGQNNIMTPLRNLKRLNMSLNSITYLPSNLLSNNVNLEAVDLSMNNIETWTIDTTGLNNLSYINLRYNAIGALPEKLLNQLTAAADLRKSTFEIDLRNNTIKYDCSRESFLKWLFKHKSNMIGFDSYNFVDGNDTPLSLKKFESKVDNMSLDCNKTLIISISFGLSCFLALVALVIYVKFWTFQRIYFQVRQRMKRKKNYQSIYTYRAFIVGDEDQSSFVEAIQNKFQGTENDMKMCTEQDCKEGRSKMQFHFETISDSDKSIVIITNDYIRNPPNVFYIDCMVQESAERNDWNYMILIIKGDLEKKKIPKTIWKWLEMDKYIKYVEEDDAAGHELFWKKLKVAIEKPPSQPPTFIK